MQHEFDFMQFVQWAFQGLIAGCFIYGVNMLSRLNKAIEELNIRMATIVERDQWHERQMEHMMARITRVEEEGCCK